MPDKQIAVTTWTDPEQASLAAAYFFVGACHQAIAERGRFIVGLSGGNTPHSLYKFLSSPAFRNNIPWKNVFLFWSDERFVPSTDKQSNYRMVKESLLNNDLVPAKNIFPVPFKTSAAESASIYEKTIRKFFKRGPACFDWLLLGLGPDGHTASLFPGTSILTERKRLVKEVWLENKKTWRTSFTFPMINSAKQIVFLATGKDKAAIVAKVLSKKKTITVLPAQVVNSTNGNVIWILDKAAASLL